MVTCRAVLLALCLLLFTCVQQGRATVEDEMPIDSEDGPSGDTDVFADQEEPVYPEQAILIAHKHPLEDKIVQGRNLTMAVTLHNVGNGYASVACPDVCHALRRRAAT